MKNVVASLGSLVLMANCVVGSTAEPEPPSPKETQVTLNAEYDTFSNSEGYGLVLIVRKWEPHETAEIHMVGPKGEMLTIISAVQSLRANEYGRLTVFVPYALPGLYAGEWELVVAGKNGIHKARIEVPPAPQHEQAKGDGT